MAAPDLKKQLSDVRKWTADSKALEKKQIALTEKTRKKLVATEDGLRKDSILWKGYYTHLFQLNASFEAMAGPVIKLQDALKQAEKAKDKAKIAELKKKLAPEEKKIAALEKKFTKNYDEMTQVVHRMRKVWDAVDKLP